MSACIVLSGDCFIDETLWYHGQDKNNQPTIETVTILDCEMFFVKRAVPPSEPKPRNDIGTFTVNFLSELYEKDDFRILKGPDVRF